MAMDKSSRYILYVFIVRGVLKFSEERIADFCVCLCVRCSSRPWSALIKIGGGPRLLRIRSQ